MNVGTKLVLMLVSFVPAACFAQVHDVLCREGNGSFGASLPNGLSVSIGAQKASGFSTRACQAALNWDKQTLTVASGVAVLDLDLFGAELNQGMPVAAFATAQTTDQCCMTYQIYSLTKPPKLLRTITGGGFFEAADTDLNGDVEIWTDDSGAVEGFEGLSPNQIEFVPTYVLRMDHGRLLDASSEFKASYDEVVNRVRQKISLESSAEFQASDGRLKVNQALSAPDLIHLSKLLATKIKVLEIVWAYLYSGREKEAWQFLSQMWPAPDVERIREEILKARSRGILSQLDGLTTPRLIKHGIPIFNQSEVTPAQAILMRVYPPDGEEVSVGHKEVHVELVIDAAGKVQSVKPAGETKTLENYVRVSAMRWKFIPAFKSGRPVASRMHTAISPQQ